MMSDDPKDPIDDIAEEDQLSEEELLEDLDDLEDYERDSDEEDAYEPSFKDQIIDEVTGTLKGAADQILSDRKIQFTLGVLVLCLIGGYFLFTQVINKPPREGSWRYAVCRTFLERHHNFPQTIDLFAVGENSSGVTIFYTVMNAFGAVEVNNIYCAYEQSPKTGRITFKTLQINGENMDQDTMDKFAFTIPYILATDPDLTLPPPLIGALDQLKKREPFHITIEGQ